MSSHHITAEPVSNIPSCQLHCVKSGSNEYKGNFFPATINLWNSLWPGKFFLWIYLSIYLFRSCLFCIIIIIFVSYGHVMDMLLWIIWINLNLNVKASLFFCLWNCYFFPGGPGFVSFFNGITYWLFRVFLIFSLSVTINHDFFFLPENCPVSVWKQDCVR